MTEPLVTGADVEAALGGGDGGAPGAGGGTGGGIVPGSGAPAGGAPAGGTSAGGTPGAGAPGAEPEFEIEPGQKVKASEIKAWRDAHKSAEALKPVQELDAFLRDEATRSSGLTGLILSLIQNEDDAKLKNLIEFWNGKTPAPQGAPAGTDGQPAGQPATALSELAKTLDLDDPSVKALYSLAQQQEAAMKGLTDRLAKLEQPVKTIGERFSREDQERKTREAEAKWRGELDRVWNAHKAGDLLARYPEEDRKEVEADLRNRILYIVASTGGRTSIDEAAKVVLGRAARVVEGVIKGYTTRKDGAPPMGGGTGGAGAPAPETPGFGKPLEQAIVKELEGAAASRGE